MIDVWRQRIMKKGEKTRAILLKHYNKYPELSIEDVLKLLHQSSFGCEHMISSPEAVLGYIEREAEEIKSCGDELVEPLDGNYSRVHLGYLGCGLSAKTLARLFFMSARREDNGTRELEEKLIVAREMVSLGELPFAPDDFEGALNEWKSRGYGALHHSEAFRAAYHPSYRVISNDYVPFLPLFARLDSMLARGPVKLAIEGGSASGKTTLAAILAEIYDATVFHMDDFFLRREQRTPERYSEIGGNVDRERFLDEVLLPLGQGETVSYRRFDCSSFELSDPITVTPKRLTVIEGAYSMHPSLSEHYDLSVFLKISPELQRERIIKRNGERMAERFFCEWIPLESVYFEKLNIANRCDISIAVNE